MQQKAGKDQQVQARQDGGQALVVVGEKRRKRVTHTYDVIFTESTDEANPVTKYWINTISRDHVEIGVQGGFTQANHGRNTMLRQLARGDLVAFYSPRTRYPDGDPLQRFTALGRVEDDASYQVEMTADFHPWRRRMEFLPCEESPIQPLLEELTFITDKQRWGYPFRRGLFQIGADDFGRIARTMHLELGNE